MGVNGEILNEQHLERPDRKVKFIKIWKCKLYPYSIVIILNYRAGWSVNISSFCSILGLVSPARTADDIAYVLGTHFWATL